MSKKISKEFYITDLDLSEVLSGNCTTIYNGNPDLSSKYRNKITITYEEPEKVISLSCSQFDEVFNDSCKEMKTKHKQWYGIPEEQIKLIKQKLFGKTE